MEQQTNQLFILLRIGNFYLGLTLLQLTLTLSYLITFHLQMTQIASWIEIILAIFIFSDLLVKFLAERTKFLKSQWNIIDVIILIVVISSIILTCTHIDSFHHSNSTDFGTAIVIIRYTIQICRVFILVKVSKQIHQQKKYQGMISLFPSSEVQIQNGDILQIQH